ncbi:response regulator transcription factor [Burkholderia sp. WSM2232]|uniref:response regulator transcription factor n=1 Tax=Burkholderia sp. WSM2232 TaxID=944436 RepID=UPI0004827A99|nr:response regulator [Burkholderia sp. WSM2232]
MPDLMTLPTAPSITEEDDGSVYIVDHEELVRQALARLLRTMNLKVHAFASIEAFIAAPRSAGPSCLVLDVRLPEQSGLAFQSSVAKAGKPHMPIIFMTGHGDIAMTVKAMKAGAMDFLSKPFRDQDMIDAVIGALDWDRARLARNRALAELRGRWATLTPREREVMQHVVAGLTNRQIAAAMGIAEITAKIHRGQAMRKMKCRSVADLVRMMDALRAPDNAP